MKKKKLDTTSIINELRGASPFFPQEQTQEPQNEEHASPHSPDTTIPRYHDTKHDTTIPNTHDTMIRETEENMLEAVRKAVKQIGKEPATQRLTLEEKQALRAIEFTYGQQGIVTSGNEIMRIATNYIIRDYQQHGEQSILAKVLRRLNS